MPKILLVNDDGVYSPGLLTLKREIQNLGEITVVAPSKERSGIGKALSCNLVNVRKVSLADSSEAYAIDGTPADAYFIATHKILREKPDLLVSGINLGPNLGIDDFFTSGTLGAAIEAAIHKVPAIAVSYCMKRVADIEDEFLKVNMAHLLLAAKIAKKTAEYILKNGMPPNVDIISINVPEKIVSLSFEATTLSYKGFMDLHVSRKGGYIISQWTLFDYPNDMEGTDIYTIKDGKISVTPIKLKFIHNVEGLKDLICFLNSKFK